MKRKVEIHIVGPTGSGKTRLREFIEQAINHGIRNRRQQDAMNAQDAASFREGEIYRESLLRRYMNGELVILEHTPAPEVINCRCETAREEILPVNLFAYHNPLAEKGTLPWVRFAPGNGWSFYHGNVKGCHTMGLTEALADFNHGVTLAADRLNLEGHSLGSSFINELPGWGDAVKEEQGSRRPVEYAEPRSSHDAAANIKAEYKRGIADGMAGNIPVDFKTSRPQRSGFGAVGALLAFAAAIGGLDDLDDLDAPQMDLERSPELVEILREAGLLHGTGPNAAIVAIPRKMGDSFCERLEDAIRANDVERVRSMIKEIVI